MISINDLVGGTIIKATNVAENDAILILKDGQMYIVTKDVNRLGGLFITEVGAVGEIYDENGELANEYNYNIPELQLKIEKWKREMVSQVQVEITECSEDNVKCICNYLCDAGYKYCFIATADRNPRKYIEITIR
jgi:hypothetical protein